MVLASESQVARALAGVSLDYPRPTPQAQACTEDAAAFAARLPATFALLRAGLRDGIFPGAQLCVARGDEIEAAVAVGAARHGVPMTLSTLLPWFCCVKPVVAFAFGQLWELGLVDVDEPVSRQIPEFGRRGKEAVTYRHVLTHTAALPHEPVRPIRFEPDPVVLEAVCDTPLAPGAVLGRTVKYWPLWGWTILAEAIRRLTGMDYDCYVRHFVLDPNGIADVRLRMTPAEVAGELDNVGLMFALDRPDPYPWPTRCRLDHYDRDQAGASVMATATGMVRVYDAMRRGQVTRPPTTAALTAPQRVGLYDEDFGGLIGFGLGMVVDGSYFGVHCSPRAWGHKGLRSSCVVVDPEHDLVLAFVTNGMVRSGVSDDRDMALTEAVYRDLGLAGTEPPPRVAEVQLAAPSRFPREPGWLAPEA
jgi:CubicO group peptidase (beta-lactamase class C family)